MAPLEKTKETAPAESGITVTGTQLVDVFKELLKSQQTSQVDLAQAMATAVQEATVKTRQWWNEDDDPHISVFNPKGEKHHPRPKFNKQIFFLGYLCQESQHTADEITLLNQVTPGRFHLRNDQGVIERYNFFTVREREPGVPNGPLVIEFPCKDASERMALSRFDRGRGLVDLLQQFVTPVVTPADAVVA